MKRIACLAAWVLVVCGAGVPVWAVLPEQNQTGFAAAEKVPLTAYPFSLSQVRLLDGPFKQAMDLDAKYLLSLEPDRLLAGFRETAGLAAKARRYGGWESRGVSGHILGHYLSACAMMFQSTGDPQFKQRCDYCIDQLAECQQATGTGFLCGFSDGKKIFAEIAAGKVDTTQGLNGGWVPWYTLHKDFAGLRDVWLCTGSDKARQVLIRFADWACELSSHLNDDQFQKMLSVEHGGMNEVLADIYSITGDAKYLDLARRFTHRAVLDPLMQQRDPLTGLHANTQIPKVIGLAREYELTGDPRYHTAASFFWEDVVTRRSFANGGNSDWERFFPIGQMAQNMHVASSETCNSYNMLKLTGHLFAWNPDARYTDYAERALFNHILASQDPDTGGFCYYVPMEPGRFKTFSSPFDSFWCCVGTGIENHSKYGGLIYSHDDHSLWVNQYIASTLDWSQTGLQIRQETHYPASGQVNLSITAGKAATATIRLRHPAWSGEAMRVAVNGEPIAPEPMAGKLPAARYIEINRSWNTGDRISIELPIQPRLEPMPDDHTKLAFFAGPVLLAADLGTAFIPPTPVAGEDQLMYSRLPMPAVPVLVGDVDSIAAAVKPVQGAPLTYTITGVARPGDLTLRPFYSFSRDRYAVYLDHFAPAEWAAQQAELEARRKAEAELTARTLDMVRPGEQQPEQDHHFQGSNTRTGTHRDRGWRDASPDGWFAYTLKTDGNDTADLLCTYWGSETGNRDFKILVDGQAIATQQLGSTHPDRFYDVAYPVPASLIHGKTQITVRFESNGGIVGGVFGVRLVKHATE